MDRTIRTINNFKALNLKVSLVNQLSIYPINNPEYLILRLSNGKPLNEDWHLKPTKGQTESKQIKQIAYTSNIPVIDSMSTFSDHGECKIIQKGKLMVKDAGHLSELGCSYFVSSMLNQNIDIWD